MATDKYDLTADLHHKNHFVIHFSIFPILIILVIQ
jgi:hypothetical protein